jgi:hypothetical protein
MNSASVVERAPRATSVPADSALVSQLQDNHRTDPAVIKSDILHFLIEMEKEGLVRIAPGS